MIEVINKEQAILFLEHVLHYIGAHYGGTWGHHLVALALIEVRKGEE
jgi:hypothetical protein